MRTRSYVTLIILTAILISIIGFFIGIQFRKPKYKPRFRLAENVEQVSGPKKKTYLEMKANLISSIIKNGAKNLKGAIPESIEFDISKKFDKGSSSLVRVFETSYVDITGFKGYTHVLKAKIPISKFVNNDKEQHGLPDGEALEAVVTYFQNDNLEGPPLVVCPVISIENKNFACYLKDSENEWSMALGLADLDPLDDSFADRAGEYINNHYHPQSPSSPEKPTEEAPTPQDPSNKFELDISLKNGFENEFFTVTKVDKVNFPGFQGFRYKFNNKTKITKYHFGDYEQFGLPTEVPFEAIATIYKDDKLDEYPLAVCGIKSKTTKSFECYLMETEHLWKFNDQISQLKIDNKFGRKVAEILNTHYSFPPSESSTHSDTEDSTQSDSRPEADSPEQESESSQTSQPVQYIEQPSSMEHDTPQQPPQPEQTSEPQQTEEHSSSNEPDTPQPFLPVESSHSQESEQPSNPTQSETSDESSESVETSEPQKSEDQYDLSKPETPAQPSLPDASSTSAETEEPGKSYESESDQLSKSDDTESENEPYQSQSEDELESNDGDENDTQDGPDENGENDGVDEADAENLPSNIDVLDLSRKDCKPDDIVQVEEFDDLDIKDYRAFGHLLPDLLPIEKFVFNDVEQIGLPINVPFEGVLTFFHSSRDDPLVVCPITSLDDTEYSCYLKDSNNRWLKNQEMSEMDFTSDDFGTKASALVNGHYGITDTQDEKSSD